MAIPEKLLSDPSSRVSLFPHLKPNLAFGVKDACRNLKGAVDVVSLRAATIF